VPVIEEQRRWWFATHPEYSRSHKGAKKPRKDEQEDDDSKVRVRPEDVDAYVDHALQYVHGPVAGLLKSVKRHFGTETGLLKQWQNVLRAWEPDGGNVRVYLGQDLYDDGTFPRLPTLQEISRWPGETVRHFFRWLNALWQANNIIWDPNAPHNHHRLVKELTGYFMDCGLDVDMYLRIMKAGDHVRLHKGKGRGGDWNREWKGFSRQWPAEKSEKHQQRIRDKLQEMEVRYGIVDKGFKWPPNPRIPL